MPNLFNKWTLRFYDPSHEAQFQEKLNIQRLYFFRTLLVIGILTCFIAMIIFIVQSAQIHIVIFMASLTIIHIIFLFFSLKLQPYLKNIFTLLYVSYVAAGTLITYAQDDVPLYNYGYSSCLLYLTVLQYSDVKFKAIFIFSTQCIVLGVFVNFQFDQLSYIVFCILMMFQQGIITYLFEYTSRLEFSQLFTIKSQQQIIYEFVQDPLFAISFNKKINSFELEFVNKNFELYYQKDYNGNQFKEFLRTYTIGIKILENSNCLCLNRSIQKQLNLEEYLFDLINNQKLRQDQKVISIEAIGDKGKLNIEIARFQYQKSILILIIRKNQTKLQIEKYENNIKLFKEKFQQVLMLIGNKLEENYKSLLQLNDTLCFDNYILRQYYCNIEFSLNYIKNHLIYLQKGKMSFLKQQIEEFTIYKLNRALSNYFIHYCYQHKKQFQLDCSYEVEQQIIYLNTRLLTQLLINCFNKIVKISQHQSIIQLKIDKKIIKNTKYNLNQDLQLISFSYVFEHKNYIDKMESQFSQSIISDSQQQFEIECIVNQIILKILSPFNIISTNSLYQQDIQNYQTTLKFLIYTDQTQLDPSFTKYIQNQNLGY
ncbi:unnamed protein product [Paramecium pentaurelia]|uniref:Transmembrane protein n=1 Tax=Paramecium pentaurelia TaxID=43138 RepID=A0A8S1XJ69_9CILI|nr:unnamed protein product [Paramecium pentaurelia]